MYLVETSNDPRSEVLGRLPQRLGAMGSEKWARSLRGRVGSHNIRPESALQGSIVDEHWLPWWGRHALCGVRRAEPVPTWPI